ncbi:DUF881 domain-containing protein [Hoyosella altamirensis]|uniref:Uncharacterized protein YlxW (UPF0749 family) n=1 Tax=Hoyosella altamirensis TaxID=616997 RepID=A0A839RJJ5_9ACTN|nr:DUF881 domain-containing protein [Hoyosella altamirensis]MBB3036296.1 uncharacterized protein YlxW (UPF0749 family) [Hoyosella altamirensis]
MPDKPKRADAPQRGARTLIFTVLVAALCGLLGLAIATQVRTTTSDDVLGGMRSPELLSLLEQLNAREAAMRNEIDTLEDTLAGILASGTDNQAAIAEAQAQLDVLAIQIGSVAARGPGVVLTVRDPNRAIGPEVLLDQVQELRAAGAEAIQVAGSGESSGGPVRIGVDSWFGGTGGAIVADGETLAGPYVISAIGDPPTLEAALNIPGGAIDTVARSGGRLTIQKFDEVEVTALRELRDPQYAQPGG